MSGPIRALTEHRGFSTNVHNLASFGGAGGQHACSVAELLGIKTVLIHRHSSVLSAHGIGLADVVHEAQKPSSMIYGAGSTHILDLEFKDLEDAGRAALISGGLFEEPEFHRFLNMRYDGSDTAMMIPSQPGVDASKSFIDTHHREFGFTPTNRNIFIDNFRVRAVAHDFEGDSKGFISTARNIIEPKLQPQPSFEKSVFFVTKWESTPVYILGELIPGMRIKGPALIIDKTQTIVVNPLCMAVILDDMVVIDIKAVQSIEVSATVLDPIQLAVFRHRFFGIAEQMGRVLQKTSVSANIKERLDFSCAIFDPEGNLVANAPHVPAMIGSMGFAVKSQIKKWGGQLRDGDVLLSNSPGEQNNRLDNLHQADLFRIWRRSSSRSHSHYSSLRCGRYKHNLLDCFSWPSCRCTLSLHEVLNLG